MPREKKQRLKKRADGRYVCRYHDQFFYSYDHDDCLRQREEYKRALTSGTKSARYVGEYADGFIDRTRPGISAATRELYNRHLRRLVDALGSVPLADVRPSDIKAFFGSSYSGMSNGYIHDCKSIVTALFDSAVADGIITSNPARNSVAKPHKGTQGGHRSITPEERAQILTLCTDHRAHPAVMAMLYAGLRPQEAKAIIIDRDVDFKAGTITVRETAHCDPDNRHRYVITSTGKTPKANRTIPLLPPLRDALQGKTGRLVSTVSGDPVSAYAWYGLWESYICKMETAINGCTRQWYGKTKAHRAMIAAGQALPPWQSFTVVPYDLRHSFATMCRDMSPPIELHTLITWMGHTDATMIMRIYDSVTDKRDAAEADRIRAAFRSQSGSQTD